MTEDEIRKLVADMSSIRDAIATAEPEDKAKVYSRLGLHLTYRYEERLVRAKIKIEPSSWGYGLCPRGDMTHNPNVTHSAELRILSLAEF